MNVINNQLYIGEVPAVDLAKKYGTPLYVYDAEAIRFKCRELSDSHSSLPSFKLFYSAAANPALALLRLLREDGVGVAGISAASPGEIVAALTAGFLPEQIMFVGVAATDEEMKFAVEKKVLVVVDSLSQLESYGRFNPRSSVALRINPAVHYQGSTVAAGQDRQFGIWAGDLEQAAALARKYGLRVVGLHQHIGSGILDFSVFMNAVGLLLAAARARAADFPSLAFLNFGGGFGVPLQKDQTPLDVAALGERLCKVLDSFGKNSKSSLHYIIEPGSYLVAEAAAVLCSVTAIKETGRRIFAGVNTTTAQVGMFGAVVNAASVEAETSGKVVVVYGNSLQADDLFAGREGCELPLPKEGDVLAITSAGAYAYSLSSRYHNRPRPAQLLISGKKVTLISAAEKLKDVIL